MIFKCDWSSEVCSSDLGGSWRASRTGSELRRVCGGESPRNRDVPAADVAEAETRGNGLEYARGGRAARDGLSAAIFQHVLDVASQQVRQVELYVAVENKRAWKF